MVGKRHRFKKLKDVGPNSKFNKEKKLNPANFKQRIPRKFTEMMELKEIYKDGNERQIKKKLRERMKNPNAEQERERRLEADKKPGESNFKHMRRLRNAVDVSVQKAKVAGVERPEKKIDQEEKPSSRSVKAKTRLLKMKEKRKKIQQTRKEEQKEKERWTDKVEFGEVVLRPPTITSKPRKAGEIKKPGQRDLLLLKKGFGNSKNSNISMARTKALTDERDRVIQAYRDMKKQKMEAVSKEK